MAKAQIDLMGVGGDNIKFTWDFKASNVPTSFTTVDKATGVPFKPKKLTWITIYGGNDTMGGYYDENDSPNTYERYFTNKTTITISPPQTSYTGLKQITSTGFELHDTSNFASFYYIAEG